ncbi:MAG: DUF4173 domain-containing protein [Planctomycetia bacterium]|nr:DUF4173 domain-containing protein [Planctomycetia bacterium]
MSGTQQPAIPATNNAGGEKPSECGWEPVSPIRWSEVLAVLAGVFIADFLYYQSIDLGTDCRLLCATGIALFFAVAPLVLWLGAWRKTLTMKRCVLTIMVWLAAARMFFLASAGLEFATFALLFLLVAEGSGVPFTWTHLKKYLANANLRGFSRPFRYPYFVLHSLKIDLLFSILVPILAALVFGVVFVMANPTLQKLCQPLLEIDLRLDFLTFGECVIWVVSCWFLASLFKVSYEVPMPNDVIVDDSAPQTNTLWYFVWRNTLAVLVFLYVVYLIFEYITLFAIPRPQHFDYPAFCHQGAAWLTLALGLATCVCAMIFTPAIYRDSRLPRLKAWATIWICTNLVLALAVYTRLGIYVERNGLTWLRVVGFFGTTAVVVGILWICVKIHKGYRLSWLLQRFAATVGVLVFLFCLLPIDYIVYSWNGWQIARGNLSCAYNIAAQEISLDGWLALFPLLDSEDENIRNGIGAHLLKVQSDMQSARLRSQHVPASWRRFELAKCLFQKRMKQYEAKIPHYTNIYERDEAIRKFEVYTKSVY